MTLFYPQELALTSPTSGGRLVGTVRLQTQETEFDFFFCLIILIMEVLLNRGKYNSGENSQQRPQTLLLI
jgi:hypothetical protein